MLNRGRTGSGGVALLAAAVAAAVAPPAAAQTAPGTVIENIANARWIAAELPVTGSSNADRLIVAERLDVALAQGSGAAALLTHAGSGPEAFVVAATAAQGRPIALAVDVDRDGRFDPSRDTPLADGLTPVLAPGSVLALVPAAPVEDLALTIDARAATGSGQPGTVFPGLGQGGGDAVVGTTGAAVRLALRSAAGAQPSLTKGQIVRAPDGSNRAVAGGTITYTLQAVLAGITGQAVIEDRIPAGTRYLAGSLRLDGQALSDAADPDGGEADDALVTVRLDPTANGAAAAPHTIQFTVSIL